VINQYLSYFSSSAKSTNCYYKILNVSTDATFDEIRQSYLNLAKTYHPDVNIGDNTQEEKFKELSEAYQVLSDPKKKEKYDLENGIMLKAQKAKQRIDPNFKNEESYNEWMSKKKERNSS